MPPINNARTNPGSITFNGALSPSALRDLQRMGLSPEFITEVDRSMDKKPAKKESKFAKENRGYLNSLKANQLKKKKSRGGPFDYFEEPTRWSTAVSVTGTAGSAANAPSDDNEVSPF